MLDQLIHLNEHMDRLVAQYGPWVYLVLFVVVFAETAFSVPLLPGDSLLFAAGLLAQKPDGGLNLWILYVVFFAASWTGDNINYQIGRLIGKKLFRSEKARIFKPSRLATTHAYFERHGGKTVVLARFIPVLRNLAPFVAGMGRMTFRSFLVYETVGAALWSIVCTTAGFLFSRIPFVSKHPLWAIAALLLFCAAGIAWEIRRFRGETSGPRARQKQLGTGGATMKNETSDFQLTVSRVVRCTVDQAWSAWANEEDLSKWFTTNAKQDFREGGRYQNADNDSGTFLQIVPQQLIRFTWEQKQHQPGSEVVVALDPLDADHVQISLTHEKLSSEDEVADLTEGWSWAMDSLKSFLETGEPVRWNDWKAARK